MYNWIENLFTKIVRIKKSQERYLNFANIAIQELCDDIELDLNDVNTMLCACAKTVESKLGFKPKKKRKPDKNKKPKWRINIVKEIETMRGEMLLLSKIERNKDPGKLWGSIRSQIHWYFTYQRGTKAKHTSKCTEWKTIW